MYVACKTSFIRTLLCVLQQKNPVPVQCPIAGKYNFTQHGDVPFETRILGGVTLSPHPNTYCKQNISDFSVCDTEQKKIAIDETYCLSVDHLGRPVDIYSKYCESITLKICNVHTKSSMLLYSK
jgi:hypothetical protein